MTEEEELIMTYKLDITAKDLVSIMKTNHKKPKEILIENFSKAIKKASNEGKRYAFVYVPIKELYCCLTTNEVMSEFDENGYNCALSNDMYGNDCIKVSW